MTIFKRIEFHPLFLIVALFAVLTGHFQEFFLFSSIISIHECGHAGMALLFNWKFDKIILFPFGGLTKLNDAFNRPIIQEFFIVIAGPITQILYYCFLNRITVLPPSFAFYHYSLLFFNLLPIYPLDGSKLLSLLLEWLFPFKWSYRSMLYFSLFLSSLGILYYAYAFNFFLFFFFLFLFWKSLYERKRLSILYERFLLERYLYDYHFPKLKRIDKEDINLFYRDRRHLFLSEGYYHSEKDILKKRFDLQIKV